MTLTSWWPVLVTAFTQAQNQDHVAVEGKYFFIYIMMPGPVTYITIQSEAP